MVTVKLQRKKIRTDFAHFPRPGENYPYEERQCPEHSSMSTQCGRAARRLHSRPEKSSIILTVFVASELSWWTRVYQSSVAGRQHVLRFQMLNFKPVLQSSDVRQPSTFSEHFESGIQFLLQHLPIVTVIALLDFLRMTLMIIMMLIRIFW